MERHVQFNLITMAGSKLSRDDKEILRLWTVQVGVMAKRRASAANALYL